MGSGEQRTIKILEKVTCAEKYSLILVDELDLLLHVSAFRKLVKELNRIAAEKKLQIVFTTHSLEILSMSEYIGIQYIENVKKNQMLDINTASGLVKFLIKVKFFQQFLSVFNIFYSFPNIFFSI